LLAVDTGLPQVSHAVFDTFLVLKEKGELGIKQFLDTMGKHPSAVTPDWDPMKEWIDHLEEFEKFERGMTVISEWVPRVARYPFQASHAEGGRELPAPVQEKRKSRARPG
jgi:hypothetical protein